MKTPGQVSAKINNRMLHLRRAAIVLAILEAG
jgi:hypothetical protein